MMKDAKLYKVTCSGSKVYFNSGIWLTSGQIETEKFHAESPVFVTAESEEKAKSNAVEKLKVEGVEDIEILEVKCMELSLISYYDGDEGVAYITVGGKEQHRTRSGWEMSGKSVEDFCKFEPDEKFVYDMVEELAYNLNETASSWF